MIGFLGTKEEARLAKMLREAEVARIEKTKDRYNLPPVEKGYLRGHAINVSNSDEPCQYGVLRVIEFEVSEKMKGPGVPVRMAGTYFGARMREGTLVDVPDPAPSVRPITPDVIYFAQHGRTMEMRAYYPGRNAMPQRKNLLLALLTLGTPAVVAIGAIVALYAFHIVD